MYDIQLDTIIFILISEHVLTSISAQRGLMLKPKMKPLTRKPSQN